MIQIKSISPIEKVYETSGSKPVLVFCDNINFYVCKLPDIRVLLPIDYYKNIWVHALRTIGA